MGSIVGKLGSGSDGHAGRRGKIRAKIKRWTSKKSRQDAKKFLDDAPVRRVVGWAY